MGLTWRPRTATSLYLITRSVGERFTAPSNPRNHVAGYLVTDIVFDTRILRGPDVFLNLSIRNLFDTDHADPGIRAATGLAAPTQHTYPGRSGLVSVRLEF